MDLTTRDKVLISILIGLIIILAVTLVYPNFLAKQEVKIYFSDSQAEYLVPESRKLRGYDLPQKVIEELIAGPQSDELGVTIPDGTKLLNIEVEAEVAVVNFSQELVDNHWGGTAGEMMTVYSIVNTLTKLEDVTRVQILVEGDKISTLAGHLDINDPLKFNENLID
jgi:spore germination protein GerM